MAKYDASIRVDTRIGIKEASAQLMTLENRIAKTADRIAGLRSKMDALKDAKIPTQQYTDAQKEVDKYTDSLKKAKEKIDKLLEVGVDQKSSRFVSAQYDVAQLENKLLDAEAVVKRLEQEGKAFTLGSGTEEYAKLGQQLQYAESELSVLNKRHNELTAKQHKVSDGYKKLGKTVKQSFDKINKSVQKSGGFLKTMASRFKGLALSLMIFNQISKAFSAMTSGIKQGFENFYKGNESFKNSVDSLKASLLTLKNSFAAAFAPLVQTIIPYIQKAVEWLTALIGKIGQFIAAVSGQKTYTRAVKQTTAAIKEQNKEQKKQLSSLDKLNNLSSSKENGADDSDAAGMFEEVPIDKGILDFLQKIKDFLKPVIDYAKKLKDVFVQGFWDGLGDWQYRWESIKDSLASIKDSLIDIWTDPAVLAAADKWAQSVAYMLGSLVGSLASIGLTIATNLLGGMAKYLEQNKDRIKQYLISMFDIWTDVNMLFAELFQSIAYVFEAFASEQGQQFTANIIGIFADAFMGVTELASKLFRDIANMIIQPFVDNKEGLRTALEGFLGVLAEVTGTIKQGIDDTFDKLNEVYDAHFKPFFDSVAQGLSDLLGQFLEFWNGSVQPILDQWAADFDELWKSHIQPFLDNAAEFLGKIADLLKTLWETVLQPIISWIIANILPRLLPILQAALEAFNGFAGFIADAASGILTVLGGLLDFITGVFSGDWDKAFSGIKDMVFGLRESIDLDFGEITDTLKRAGENIWKRWKETWENMDGKVRSILRGIKGFVKGIADWLVKKIKGIGEALDSVKSRSSGGWFSGGITSGARASSVAASPYAAVPDIAALADMPIPGYATGQVIPGSMKQHIAIRGDNTRETEVVSTLSKIEQAVINAMAKVNRDVGNNNGGTVKIEIPVIINGIGEIGRAVQQFDMEFFKQNGRHAFS